MFGQNVPFLKWRLAVFCLHGGEPCRQVVNIHFIRRVTVKRPVRPDLVVERQVTLQALMGRALTFSSLHGSRSGCPFMIVFYLRFCFFLNKVLKL